MVVLLLLMVWRQYAGYNDKDKILLFAHSVVYFTNINKKYLKINKINEIF